MGRGQYGSNRTVPKSATRGGSQPGRVKPRMSKLYDGRNVATRPIPVITDYGDALALRAAAADQRPKAKAVNMPSAPHPVGGSVVLGTKVAGATRLTGGVFNPATGLGEHT
jgi:hypothetical protein